MNGGKTHAGPSLCLFVQTRPSILSYRDGQFFPGALPQAQLSLPSPIWIGRVNSVHTSGLQHRKLFRLLLEVQSEMQISKQNTTAKNIRMYNPPDNTETAIRFINSCRKDGQTTLQRWCQQPLFSNCVYARIWVYAYFAGVLCGFFGVIFIVDKWGSMPLAVS